MSMLLSKRSVRDVSFRGKRVFLRADFNVPLENGVVADDQRIVTTLPTIAYILQQSPQYVVIGSHLGRPDGRRVPALSLRPVADRLVALGVDVLFVDDCVGPAVSSALSGLAGGSVVLLENLRFQLEEEGAAKIDGKKVVAAEECVAEFRQSLAGLCDVYVNDAFGTAHRAHSSIVGVAQRLRQSQQTAGSCVAGLLMERELAFFAKILAGDRIDLAILGGAKVSDKIRLIESLLQRVRRLAIGGAMAFTFLKVLRGTKIGSSLFDEPGAACVQSIQAKADALGVEIVLPLDFVCSPSIKDCTDVCECDVAGGVPDGRMGLDIGPRTSARLAALISDVREGGVVFWNGPVGVFEVDKFSGGTRAVLESLVGATSRGVLTIVGGGDSAYAASKFGMAECLTHVSTGGGASIELLEGRELEGVAVLSDK